MKPKNLDILCIGEVLWDRLPDKSIPGGAPMNVALHLKKVGYRVMMSSSVGNDQHGRDLAVFMNNEGVDTSLVQTNFELPTSEVPVVLDEFNNPTFDILEPVAWDQMYLTDELHEAAQKVGTVVYGTLASRNELTRKTIHAVLEHDNIKLIDINMRPPYVNQNVVEDLVRKADIVKMNEDELRTMADWHHKPFRDLQQLIQWFGESYPVSKVCVTRGKDGAMVLEDGIIFEHPGFHVNTVDTVGSGDAFLAGFISRLFEGSSAKEAITYACALGAYVATKAGATPAYDSQEILSIMNAS